MANHLCLAVCIALVTIVIRDISAIKCWRCSSTSSKFCGDTLYHHNFNSSEEQLNWYLVRCGSVRKKVDYKGDKMIAKCNVRIDLVHDTLVYTRKCVEEAENANSNACLTDEWFNDSDDPNVKLMSCETCTEEDGCNRKIKNYFGTETKSSGKVALTNLLIQPKVVLCLFIILIYSHCNV
ncbi:uncharacterized protein LOC119075693 [Bradysia coprophila]|uniref:uncharacterized protein LOC119075693 n=1 Tax=Bradysia coprophila TaxID=38358 RepID=UPI00187D7BC2|nr:uncharacterized protein LOC119075693 [Bradysia coprophila]XP_037038111.1 uncharacterized protein LOC119075693 [Bradysia coprophila]XP_037038112.1 uncharacterized protein LOC119075693 [Bradysia coprophila]XP_037038113.1 uncharacterized protein LOC119075693 [Bradysia coprophila]